MNDSVPYIIEALTALQIIQEEIAALILEIDNSSLVKRLSKLNEMTKFYLTEKLTNGETFREALDSINLQTDTLRNIAYMCCMDCGYGTCDHDIAKTALNIEFEKKCGDCSGLGIVTDMECMAPMDCEKCNGTGKDQP